MKEAIISFIRRIRLRVGGFLLVCSDNVALAGALILSLCLHYDHLTFSQAIDTYIYNNIVALSVALVVYSITFHAFRLYRYAWRFASLETLWGVIGANTIGLAGLGIAQHFLGNEAFSPSVYAIFWMLSNALVGGVRILLRLASLGSSHGRGVLQWAKSDCRPKRVVILSDGISAARVLSAMQEKTDTQYEVLGVLDDTAGAKGTYIRNARVLGPLRHLHKLLDERSIDEVLIALSDVSGAKIKEYVMACRKKQVTVKIVPGLHEMLNGSKRPQLEEISVEDLLRRPPVRINMDKIGGCVTGARVLVTGAGGSIGSELCRQILALDPSSLVLLGHGENSIHDIYQELKRKYPNRADKLRMVIASVADEVRMDQVFKTHRPQLVFHAAAHKHVPIMESNLIEAVQNNVIGTNCVAECCGRYGVQIMVLISSDKAVSPSSVMGATKWLCEEVVRSMVRAYPRSKYVTVRFGNVLGSRGSVVPIFHTAIKNGGPVLVTHPEMTRFFMSIPEAVQLVLQASVVGDSGELYLLDMGQPVKILDLACDMIRLCGFEPDKDIPIEFCGIRPGEKMHEVLTTEVEELIPASCEGMFVVNRSTYFGEIGITNILERMRETIIDGDTLQMRDMLEELVPGFCMDQLFGEDTEDDLIETAKVAEA